MNTPHSTPNAGAIVGIEHQDGLVVLAIRSGDAQLSVALEPRRAALIQARLACATADALQQREQDAAELARAQAGEHAERVMHRSNIDGVEGADGGAVQAHEAMTRMAAGLAKHELQRISQTRSEPRVNRNC